ncbi:MAG TPA: hypothetical protein VGS06_37245 [Streptosporangiaceae bacterium]|nr:hypothetical protein [Streptosporangiaceae bacterium]
MPAVTGAVTVPPAGTGAGRAGALAEALAGASDGSWARMRAWSSRSAGTGSRPSSPAR